MTAAIESAADRSSCRQLRRPEEMEPVEGVFALLMYPVSDIRPRPNSGSDVI